MARAKTKFDLDAWLKASTKASGVPLYVADPGVMRRGSKLMASILHGQNNHSTKTRPGSN